MEAQSKKVTKAVIPVAGFGSRMLPATKAIPKEMLPIIDKPLIQYIIEECSTAGITEIVMITHSYKSAIVNHFDVAFELEESLSSKGKTELLHTVRNTKPDALDLTFVRQGQALGLGHAVLKAKQVIGNSPFAVILPDVLIDEHNSRVQFDNLKTMVENFEKTGASQIMVEEVADKDVSKFGIVDIGDATLEPGASTKMTRVVEKPALEDAPSNLAVVGRYIFTENLWPLLEKTEPGVGGEIQLTDAMDELLRSEDVFAYYMHGKSHDCGNKRGYFKAILEYAKRHPDLADLIINL